MLTDNILNGVMNKSEEQVVYLSEAYTTVYAQRFLRAENTILKGVLYAEEK